MFYLYDIILCISENVYKILNPEKIIDVSKEVSLLNFLDVSKIH